MKRKRKGTEERRLLDGPIHGRIKQLRERLKMSQVALAERVGVHKTAVYHWEARHARPDIKHLAAVAKALGVTVEYLIRGEDKEAA